VPRKSLLALGADRDMPSIGINDSGSRRSPKSSIK
jgi:hypothetical protein